LSFRIIWGEVYDSYHYRKNFSFELQIIKVFEITAYICKNFSSLGYKFKQKFKISQDYELTRFYFILLDIFVMAVSPVSAFVSGPAMTLFETAPGEVSLPH
jgi:hypothetical protein